VKQLEGGDKVMFVCLSLLMQSSVSALQLSW